MIDSEYIKRVIVISPNISTQDELGRTASRHFRKDFSLFPGEVAIQKFYSVGESYDRRAEIGRGGEVIVFYDSRNANSGFLKVLTNAVSSNCDKIGIPYIEFRKPNMKPEELVWIYQGREIFQDSWAGPVSPLRDMVHSRLSNKSLFEILKKR